MNNSEAITSEELAFFETHYDAGTMPAMDPTADYLVIDLDDIEMSHEYNEMADEYNEYAEDIDLQAFAQGRKSSFDLDDPSDSFTDDGSWFGR